MRLKLNLESNFHLHFSDVRMGNDFLLLLSHMITEFDSRRVIHFSVLLLDPMTNILPWLQDFENIGHCKKRNNGGILFNMPYENNLFEVLPYQYFCSANPLLMRPIWKFKVLLWAEDLESWCCEDFGRFGAYCLFELEFETDVPSTTVLPRGLGIILGWLNCADVGVGCNVAFDYIIGCSYPCLRFFWKCVKR